MRIADELQTKYWQVPEVSDLKDMIYRSAEKYGKKTAFSWFYSLFILCVQYVFTPDCFVEKIFP